MPLKLVFTTGALEAQRAAAEKPYLEFLRVPAMSAGLYVLAAGASDKQKPHTEDEIYYVLRGKARMRVTNDEFQVASVRSFLCRRTQSTVSSTLPKSWPCWCSS